MTARGYAFWLYGSSARGDADTASDFDVLAIGREPLPDFLCHRRRVSVSRYDLSEIESMAGYGSLFLHHLKLEGYPLVESGETAQHFRNLLRHLPSYSRVTSDLKSFRLALDDVRQSVADGCSPLFEASALGMVVRHIAILGTYVFNVPCFAREESITKLGSELELDASTVETLAFLQRYRLHEDGRYDIHLFPTAELLVEWTELAEEFLTELERRSNVTSHWQTAHTTS